MGCLKIFAALLFVSNLPEKVDHSNGDNFYFIHIWAGRISL